VATFSLAERLQPYVRKLVDADLEVERDATGEHIVLSKLTAFDPVDMADEGTLQAWQQFFELHGVKFENAEDAAVKLRGDR
jgi:hypothetical protein